jgi:Protein of unknown function (DUF3750)
MAPRVKRLPYVLAGVFLLPIVMRAGLYAVGDHPRSWRDADWSSTGLLPPAASDRAPRVLVFAARNGTWRSIFAVHTWIVVKPENADRYTRYDVTGFGQPIRVNGFAADARWFSYEPQVVGDIRGERAAAAIPKIEAAVKAYPYAHYGDYRIWPGPNSNTFTATVLRAVPELAVAMPPEAIGKDFRPDGSLFGLTDSRTGYEISIFGLLGAKLGWIEGVELNVLTLVTGLDVRHPALKLPGFGRIGIDTIAATATARGH